VEEIRRSDQVNTVSTDPTMVPSTNQQNPDIPPLPYIHLHVNDTTGFLEARIVTRNKVVWVSLDHVNAAMSVSRYAQEHGLLGNWKKLAEWMVKPR
jgi:hypothetical protein